MKSTSLGFALLMGVVDDIVNTDHPYPLNVFADYDQLLFLFSLNSAATYKRRSLIHSENAGFE